MITDVARAVLVHILSTHKRTDIGCACGWTPETATHAEHVADRFADMMQCLVDSR